jgi:hypothetical protein
LQSHCGREKVGEENRITPRISKPLNFRPPTEDFALTIPARFAPSVRADIFAETLSETPPTPPPRPALA